MLVLLKSSELRSSKLKSSKLRNSKLKNSKLKILEFEEAGAISVKKEYMNDSLTPEFFLGF